MKELTKKETEKIKGGTINAPDPMDWIDPRTGVVKVPVSE